MTRECGLSLANVMRILYDEFRIYPEQVFLNTEIPAWEFVR